MRSEVQQDQDAWSFSNSEKIQLSLFPECLFLPGSLATAGDIKIEIS